MGKPKFFSDLFWTYTFLWVCVVILWYSVYMQFLSNFLVFNVGFLCIDKEKNEGNRDKALEVIQLEGRGLVPMGRSATIMSVRFFVWTFVIKSNNQQSVHGYPVFGVRDPFCWLWLLLAICRLLQECVYSYLPWG